MTLSIYQYLLTTKETHKLDIFEFNNLLSELQNDNNIVQQILNNFDNETLISKLKNTDKNIHKNIYKKTMNEISDNFFYFSENNLQKFYYFMKNSNFFKPEIVEFIINNIDYTKMSDHTKNNIVFDMQNFLDREYKKTDLIQNKQILNKHAELIDKLDLLLEKTKNKKII